jgi:hypothetical protein
LTTAALRRPVDNGPQKYGALHDQDWTTPVVNDSMAQQFESSCRIQVAAADDSHDHDYGDGPEGTFCRGC